MRLSHLAVLAWIICLNGPSLNSNPRQPASILGSPELDRHKLSLEASQAVYDVPDLEGSLGSSDSKIAAEEFLSRMEAVRFSLPKNYYVSNLEVDGDTGLKFIVLKPYEELLRQDPTTPHILSIAGTQSSLDWLGNLNLGQEQLESLRKLAAQHFSLFEHKYWIITGHSLGGGLAQAYTYFLAQFSLKLGTGLQLELVTWNAFGMREILQKHNLWDSRIAQSYQQYHYFVPGDLVPSIGRATGPYRELQIQGLETLSFIERHSLKTVQKNIALLPLHRATYGNTGENIAPKKSEQLSYAALRYGSYFSFLPRIKARWNEDKRAAFLKSLQEHRQSKPGSILTWVFVENQIQTFCEKDFKRKYRYPELCL